MNTNNILELKGSDLVGLEYEPMFPFFADKKQENTKLFSILNADFVDTQDGTGLVHIAPGFGEEDHAICKQHNIEVVCPVNDSGCFTSEIFDIENLSIKSKNIFESEKDIINFLNKNKIILLEQQYKHSYPHCWRTDTPLIYKAVPGWYVKVTDIKDRMCELNKKINWIPSHIQGGLFGKWLENAKDWNISRNRFWGSPVPVWVSSDPEYSRTDVYGSIAELTEEFQDSYTKDYLEGKNSGHYINKDTNKFEINDLHRPYIDELIKNNPDDPRSDINHPDHKNCSKMKRITDVFDCWFESGSMPFASIHYPFENKELFEKNFPADFIVEYLAQTRGWFYTLMVLSVALFDDAPFLNCICHGVILDKNGQKLSKRLKNYPDPLEMFDKYGSDAMRWTMLKSHVMTGKEMKINNEGTDIKDSLRITINGIKNATNFLQSYAVNGVSSKLIDVKSENSLDIYINTKFQEFLNKYKSAMDAYDTPLACKLVDMFIETMNNWYIRRSKDRFIKHNDYAICTLHNIIKRLLIAIAPMLPITSEAIFQDLEKMIFFQI